MKRLIATAFLFVSLCLGASVCPQAQPLRDVNYDYLYNPEASVFFDLKPIRGESSYTILYSFQVEDTTNFTDEYSLQWESRQTLADKEGKEILWSSEVSRRLPGGMTGRLTIPTEGAPKYVVARVTQQSARRAWLFYTTLEPEWPVGNFLERNGSPVIAPFIHTTENVKLGYDSGQWVVSYYDDDFPAAAPAFSEAQTRVPAKIEVDSVFTMEGNEVLPFAARGLYLVQQDTNSLRGLSFRAEEDYPQYSKLVNLPGPLIYISTRQEYDRLEASRGNKRAFDRVILNITSDTERARRLMRNYFRRVELANRYFTSYKEGWKTDRGMIYIIFGKPDQLYRFNDREMWNYKSGQFDVSFEFTRSPSLFDPDNYVLIRKKKYEDTWYEVIDLWRNARF